jgi:DnaJ-class molecular chaperone
MQNKDYYNVLGVPKTATEKEIKGAYRKLARQYHPDVNPGDSKAEAKFQDINEAYEILSDTEKRQQYDQFGSTWGKNFQGGGRPGGGHGGQPFDFDFSGVDFGGGAGGAGMGDLFEQMFGKGRGRKRPSQGGNARADVEVSLEEAFHGSTKTLTITSQVPCPACGGAGVGRGVVCHTCGGSGRRSEDSTLEVKIPAGVSEGAKIRIKGKGEPGQMGGTPGDLYLTIHLRKHPDYEVKGRDLHVTTRVDLFTAVLGGKLEVNTLKGKVDLKIPPGTQGGAKFRLTGFGLPGSGGKPGGNLFVEAQISIPEKLTDQQREMFLQLSEQLSSNLGRP